MSHQIRDRMTTYSITVDVSDAPLTPRRFAEQVIISPTRVRLEWTLGDGRAEKLGATIYGRRVLKDGGTGQQFEDRYRYDADLPQWVRDLAAEYREHVHQVQMPRESV